MNLASIIASMRARWQQIAPSVPIYLQLAHATAQVPFAVMKVGTVTPADPTVADDDYEAPVTFAAFVPSDTECLALIDQMAAAFDRTRFPGPYSSIMTSTEFDINYADQATFWSLEMQITIRWNRNREG